MSAGNHIYSMYPVVSTVGEEYVALSVNGYSFGTETLDIRLGDA
jgi:hypothetical protein